MAIGEAKHTTRARTLADLDRLDRIRALLAGDGKVPSHAKLLLFAANGFERNLTELAAKREDVELIDLDRMYGGH